MNGVIFDMDGVLADTGPIHFESWKKLADEIGVSFTKSFFNHTFGQTSPEIVEKIVKGDMSKSKIRELADRKERYYREMVAEKLKPLPGVIELIGELDANKFKMAVGSSGPPENVNLLISELGIKRYFDAIVTAADVDRGKPNPEVFLVAAEKMTIQPANCVVIEDAPVGIEAAIKAEMKVIALTTTHERQELTDADLIVKDLSEVSLSTIRKLLEQ